MATIAARTFAVYEPTTDKYLALANEEYVRTLAIGSNWTQLRIGIMYAIPGTANIPSAKLCVGLCASAFDPLSASTTGHFVGANFTSTNFSSATLTYNAGAGLPYFTSPGFCFFKRVGTAATVFGNFGATIYHPNNGGSTQRRGVVIVELLKGASWTVRGWAMPLGSAGPPATGVFRDYGYVHLLEALEDPATSTLAIDGNTLVYHSVLGSVNEGADGYLDAVDIFWSKGAQFFELYAIAVQRLA